MLHISRETIFLVAFVLMSVIYALFSSSTPDNFGLPEVIIGLLLVFLVGIRKTIEIPDLLLRTAKQRSSEGIPVYIQAILLYFLIVPTVTGVLVNGNDIGDWMRDFIPLLYFFLPVLVFHRVHDAHLWSRWIVISLCLVGIAFSIRHFVESGHSFLDVGSSIVFGTMAYFTQDPAVPFAGAFLTCFGISLLMERKFLLSFLILGLAVFPWMAILATALRAPLGLIGLSAILITLIGIYRSRHKVFDAILFALLVLISVSVLSDRIGSAVGGALDLMLQKQERVGQSGRVEEFVAVVDNAGLSVPKMLFGEGWGGSMANPTGNGAKFRFTHNVVSYFILKAGFIGMVLLFVYLMWVCRLYFSSMTFLSGYSSSINISIGVVLLMHLILEPGYKMLPLGMVFILILIQSRIEPTLGLKNIFQGRLSERIN